MDETDIVISKILLGNSRITLSEMADNLKVSVNAVSKRLQHLVDVGIIQRFRAYISLPLLKAVSILVYGVSRISTFDLLKKNLERIDSIYWITHGAGNYVYIGVYLRSLEEMDKIVTLITNLAEISEPTIGIVPNYPGDGTIDSLEPIDWSILGLLQFDSRKNAAEIAMAIGSTPKTVSRHIDIMLQKGMVNFQIEWYPDKERDILAFFHIQLDTTADRFVIMVRLNHEFPKYCVFTLVFCNLPHVLISVFWFPTMKILQDTRAEGGKIPGIKAVEINMSYTGAVLDTWRDKLIQTKVAEATKNLSKR